MEIQETMFKDFPSDKIPWALDESGRFRTNEVDDNDPVLILWNNDMPVAYLCYQKWIQVKIIYVQTQPDSQKKGYASMLLTEICKRYHNSLDIKAVPTSKAAERLLRKFGFEQDYSGAVSWTLAKGKDETNN